jgi:hypothetical protein
MITIMITVWALLEITVERRGGSAVPWGGRMTRREA